MVTHEGCWRQCDWYSVQFSRLVVSDSLPPHESQHTRPPCPSPTPGVHSNSCPLSQWCHPAILCCPVLLLPPISPSIRVFSNESTLCMRWPKYWSFSFSVSPSNEHPGLISFWELFWQCVSKTSSWCHKSPSPVYSTSFLPSNIFAFLVHMY